MKTEHQLHIKYHVFNSLTDLPEKAQNLMKQAITTREKAYAPYSKFKVGAAVLLKNGQTFIGSNQENAAYPSGLCAERVAIYQASTQYPDEEIRYHLVELAANHFPNTKPNKKNSSLSILWEQKVKSFKLNLLKISYLSFSMGA